MTLGELIDALERMPGDMQVRFEPVGIQVAVPKGAAPRRFDSYRGYYARLMLDWYDEFASTVTVSEVLQECYLADGNTYTGYKGGEYTMDRGTPVHIAQWGLTSDDSLAAVVKTDAYVALIVVYERDW